MKFILKLAILFLAFFSLPVFGTVYYVANTNAVASNSNIGSQASPWLTVAHGFASVSPGDMLRVEQGTYNERPTLGKDSVTVVGDGFPVLRGVTIDNRSNVNLLGLWFTQTDQTWASYDPISARFITNCLISDNVLSNLLVNHAGISMAQSSLPMGGGVSNVIRGNTFIYVGTVLGVYTNSQESINLGGAWNVVEYNTFYGPDHHIMDDFGHHQIIRNNWCPQFTDDSFYIYDHQSQNPPHRDFLHTGDSLTELAFSNCVVECNLVTSNACSNGHFFFGQYYGTYATNGLVQNDILRGNIVWAMGTPALVTADSMPNVYCYNNSSISNFLNSYVSVYAGTNFGTAAQNATNFEAFDNLFDSANSTVGGPPYIYNLDNAGAVASSIIFNTLAFNSATPSSSKGSDIVGTDPKLVDIGGRNFHLQSSSPAIGAGTNFLWVTSLSGSGTAFAINNSQLLCDGFGLGGDALGDVLTLASGQTLTVISNNPALNSVTVAPSVSWTNNEPIYWGKNARSDIGALPYGSQDLTSSVISQTGNTYSVTTTGDARGVWFYSNGIPVQWVYSAPYQATFDVGTITAKAYALYAQQNPVVWATPYRGLRTTRHMTVGKIKYQ